MNSKKDIYKLPPGSTDHYTAYVGPPSHWDIKAAMQFRLLCAFGLRENHTLLDFGCGSLRAGRLFIPYLLPEKYFGLDPNKWLIDDSIKNEVGNDLIEIKKPKFFYNDDFKCPSDVEKFDFILAQSICSHAAEDLVDKILSEFSTAIKDDGVILMTFVLKEKYPKIYKPDQKGWIYPGCASHAEETLATLFMKYRLHYKKLKWEHTFQTWFVLSRDARKIPSDDKNLEFTGGTYL